MSDKAKDSILGTEVVIVVDLKTGDAHVIDVHDREWTIEVLSNGKHLVTGKFSGIQR